MQPKPVIPEKIFIQSINITNAQVNAVAGQTPESWDKIEYRVATKTQFAKDSNDCKIIISTEFRKKGEAEESVISANFTIEFDFIVTNLDDFRTVQNPDQSEENPIIIIQKDLGLALMSIVYSTARGIIMTRTAGTVLDGIILPVIDPESILE